MIKKNIKPDDLSSPNARKILDFLNGAYTDEDIIEIIEKADGKSSSINLAKAILNKRTELNTFTNVKQLLEIKGINPQLFSNIASLLTKPHFTFNSEKLIHIMWTHGTSLHVEHPDMFSRIERTGWGTRLVGKSFPKKRPFVPSETWVHFAIPTPA